MFSLRCHNHSDVKKIKFSLYSRYYTDACNEWRSPSPRLSAWATQLRKTSQRWRAVGDTCPVHMSNFSGLQARGAWFWFLHHNQFLDVIITFFNYNIKKLIMMQKLESRTAGLKPTKIRHVDRVIVSDLTGPGIETQTFRTDSVCLTTELTKLEKVLSL